MAHRERPNHIDLQAGFPLQRPPTHPRQSNAHMQRAAEKDRTRPEGDWKTSKRKYSEKWDCENNKPVDKPVQGRFISTQQSRENGGFDFTAQVETKDEWNAGPSNGNSMKNSDR